MKFAEILCERAEEAAGCGGYSAAGSLRLLSVSPCSALETRTSLEQRLRSRSSPARDSNKDAAARVARVVPDEFARAQAYYSLRPPALPLQLVAVAHPAPPATMPPPAPAFPPPPSCTAIVTVQLDEERCKNAVRSVLCELLATLPLSSLSSPAPGCGRRRRTRSPCTPRHARSPRHSCSPCPRRTRSPRPRLARQSAPTRSAPPLQKAPSGFSAHGFNRS